MERTRDYTHYDDGTYAACINYGSGKRKSAASCDMALLGFPEHYHFVTAILQALYNSNAFL